MSRQAHYSVTALSEAAGGREFPTLAVVLAYVEACGGDRREWEARWQAVAAELGAGDALEQPAAQPQGAGCDRVGLARQRCRWPQKPIAALGLLSLMAVMALIAAWRPHMSVERQTSLSSVALGSTECPDGAVCFWSDREHRGDRWAYHPANGYQDVPTFLHDHAYSFLSRAHVQVNAIDWLVSGQRANHFIIRPGDFSADWGFGLTLDAVELR